MSYVQMVSYSEDPMFRKSYVQKYLFRRSYTQKKVLNVQKILYSEIFVRKVLISRRSYVQKVLYSEDHLFRRFYAGTHFHLSASGIETSRVSFFISFTTLLFTFSRDTRE